MLWALHAYTNKHPPTIAPITTLIPTNKVPTITHMPTCSNFLQQQVPTTNSFW